MTPTGTRRTLVSRQERRAAIALLAVSLSLVAALARLVEHPGTTRLVVPIILAVVVAHVVSGAVSRGTRWSIGFVLGALCGSVAGVIAVNPHLVVPGSSSFLQLGIPFDQIRSALRVVARDGTPLPRQPGVTTVLAAAAGATAAMGRALWQCPAGSRRPPALTWFALAPASALVLYSALVSADQDRMLATLIFVAAAALFVGLADSWVVPSISRRSAAGDRDRRTLAGVKVATGTLAALSVVAFAPLLNGLHLNIFRISPPGLRPVTPRVNPSAHPTTTVPQHSSGSVPTSVPAGATPTSAPRGQPLGGAATRVAHHAPPGSFPWWLVMLAVLLVALALGAYLWWRRRTPALGIPRGNNQIVVHAFERAQRAVKRARLDRRPTETPAEYRARLGALQIAQPPGLVEGLGALAELVALACFSSEGCSSEQAHDADRLAHELARRAGRVRLAR